MSMTLYQRSYLKALGTASKTSYVNSVYDTQSKAADTTSHWKVQDTAAKAKVHAYTRKLTVLNGGTPA